MRLWRKTWPVIKQTFSEWSSDKCPRLGAALSYYTVFSIAPVLIVAIAVAGIFLGRQAAEGKIVQQLSGLLGTDVAGMLQSAVGKSAQARHGWAAAIGIVTLLLGATGVM